MKTYDIDPVLLCKCGPFDSEHSMVGVVGGRYVEAQEAQDRIDALVTELAVVRGELTEARASAYQLVGQLKESESVVAAFREGCRSLIDRLRTGEL